MNSEEPIHFCLISEDTTRGAVPFTAVYWCSAKHDDVSTLIQEASSVLPDRKGAAGPHRV